MNKEDIMKLQREFRYLLIAVLFITLQVMLSAARANAQVIVSTGGSNEREARIRRCNEINGEWRAYRYEHYRNVQDIYMTMDEARIRLDEAHRKLERGTTTMMSQSDLADANREVNRAQEALRRAQDRMDRLYRYGLAEYDRKNNELRASFRSYGCEELGVAFESGYQQPVAGAPAPAGNQSQPSNSGVSITVNPSSPSIVVNTGSGTPSTVTNITPADGSFLAGTWYRNRNQNAVCKIENVGGNEPLLLTNELGESSRGYLDGSTVVATSWSQGIFKGVLSPDRNTIDWGNGVVWARQPN